MKVGVKADHELAALESVQLLLVALPSIVGTEIAVDI